MRLILLSDVQSLGSTGEIVEVAPGYANNFLLPRGLAAEASSGALATLEQQRKAKARRQAENLAKAQELAKLLESKPVPVQARAGGNGRLFGTVTNTQIAEAIQKSFDVIVDRHKIELKSPIKSVGTFPVEVKLGHNVTAKTLVEVVAA
ncbi:MAG: 50S ribosomal protein L9 [Candidatus Eremiobacteraeota bacterium]|nr:50S ribosomal protein L9 [Candidatus Eremiobacteraeota bacterium]MBV8356188.1 50S ribosomal protein L9 [Candidatus Eremiobacteraeota bacterium]